MSFANFGDMRDDSVGSRSRLVADWRGEMPGAAADNDGWALVTELRMEFRAAP